MSKDKFGKQQAPVVKPATQAEPVVEKTQTEETPAAEVTSTVETEAVVETTSSEETPATTTTMDDPEAIINPSPETTETPAAKLPEVVVVKAVEPDTVEGAVMGGNNLTQLSSATRNVISTMQQYINNMRRGQAIDPMAGAGHQRRLYAAILGALTGDEVDVKPSLDAIAWFFQKYRADCFESAYAFRFIERMAADPEAAVALQRLIHLFTVISDPSSRATVRKQINVEMIANALPSIEARERLVSYIGA